MGATLSLPCRAAHSNGFSRCGAQALGVGASVIAVHRVQFLQGLWDLPEPGIKPMSPALAGGFLTTRPPGEPSYTFNTQKFINVVCGFLNLHLKKQILLYFPLSSIMFLQVSSRIHKGLADGKVSACNAGDPGSIPGSGRSPGEGNGNPLQHSCLESPMDGGA